MRAAALGMDRRGTRHDPRLTFPCAPIRRVHIVVAVREIDGGGEMRHSGGVSVRNLIAFVLLLSAPILACATFYPEDNFGWLAEEVALIVWDSEAQQQHFIRRARFDTKAKEVGFLVPTPTQPELAEIDNAIFNQLDYQIRPRRVVKKSYIPIIAPVIFMVLSAGGEVPHSPVEVYDRRQMAGQDVAVLKATDVAALEDWLKRNEFGFDAAAREWLAPYVDEGYFISAFRFTATSEDRDVRSKAVRMTFSTPTPYFPYREPERPLRKPHHRSLRVYLVAESSAVANLGNSAWAAEKKFSAPLEELPEELRELTGNNKWLTVFDDTSEVRASEHDLTFELVEAEELRPPDRVFKRPLFVIPLEPTLLLLLIGIFVWRRKKRLKNA